MSRSSDLYRNSIRVESELLLKAKLSEQRRVVRPDEVPIYGNSESFNMNEILTNNIYNSRYFLKILDIREFEDLISEAENKVKDLEPLVIGTSRDPSTAFCILFKLFVIRITLSELQQLLNHKNMFLVGLGFLYIRFAYDPRQLWAQYAEFFDDETYFTPFRDGTRMMMGKWLTKLIQDKRYGDTLLPAIPIPVKRDFDTKLLKLQMIEKRPLNEAIIRQGTKVKGLFSGDLMWYPAVVTKVISETSYLITYDSFGNNEVRTRAHILVDGEDPFMTASSGSSTSAVHESKATAATISTHSKSHSRSRSRSTDHTRSHPNNSNSNSNNSNSNRSPDRHRRHRSRSGERGHRHKEDRYKDNRYKDDRYKDDWHKSERRGRSRSDDRYRSSETTEHKAEPVDLFDDKRLAELVRERERKAVVAEGDHYADHVHHVKASLMMPPDKYVPRSRK